MYTWWLQKLRKMCQQVSKFYTDNFNFKDHSDVKFCIRLSYKISLWHRKLILNAVHLKNYENYEKLLGVLKLQAECVQHYKHNQWLHVNSSQLVDWRNWAELQRYQIYLLTYMPYLSVLTAAENILHYNVEW
jgi:hypothetical protein